MTEFRKGDVVTVQGTVEYHYGLDVEVKIEGNDSKAVSLRPEQLTLVRRDFNVGDRVIGGGIYYSVLGAIVAIDNNAAWIRDDDGDFWKIPISLLRHRPNPRDAQLTDILSQSR